MTIGKSMESGKSRSKRLIAALVALSFITGCAASSETLEAGSDADSRALISRDDAARANLPDGAPEFGDSLDDLATPDVEAPPVTAPAGYELFEWDDLITADGSTLEDDARFSAQLQELEDGTPEANALYEEWQASTEAKGQIVNTALDGKKIHMAGFATPLDFEAEVVTEFLFVPYFGACVHVPPPPVNQTVMVKLDADQAMDMKDTWGAIWVTGELAVVSATTDLATAGYTITQASTEPAEDF